MKTSAWALLVTSFAVGAGAQSLACGGTVSGNPTGSDPTSSTSPTSSPTTTASTPGSAPTSNPDPGSAPAIIVDGSAAAGRFTAIAIDASNAGANGSTVYVAEVVDDASTGSPTAATTIWKLAPDGTKTAVIASADIGNPFGMTINLEGVAAAPVPYWIDGLPFGSLKSISGGAVSTVSKDVSGTMMLFAAGNLYAEYTSPEDASCIANVSATSPACAVSDYAVPLQGGSGFRVIDNVLYAASPSAFLAVDLSTNKVTSTPLPSALLTALGPNDNNGAVYDVDIAADGTAYLATQIGVWKMDTAGNFESAFGSTIVQQIAIVGNSLLALVISGGVSIEEYSLDGSIPARTLTSDAQLDTRFVIDRTNVYWLDPLGTTALHTAF